MPPSIEQSTQREHRRVLLPKADEEEPNAGAEEAPKAGVDEAPKAGVDEAPKAGEVSGDDGCPKTPVDVLPNIELPVGDPNGLGLPKGLGLNGLLVALLACPNNVDCPNGLLEDCPKAAQARRARS